MKTAAIFTVLLLGNVLFAQAPNLCITPASGITPVFQGTVATYPVTAGSLDIPGQVFEVSNGATVASLGLSLTVDGPTGTQAYLSPAEVRPQPSGYSPAEWSVLSLMATPYSVTPTSGTFANDTTYYFHMQAAAYTSQGFEIVDFALIFVVGNPNGQGVQESYPSSPANVAMAITPTVNSQAIGSTVDVPVGTSLSAMGLDIYAENGAWGSIGVQTSISNTAGTGINASEFCAYGHHDLNVPGSAPTGTFSAVGTHNVHVLAWGLIIGLINQGGYLHWTHQMMALQLDFTINVVPDPTIEVSDSTGSIAPGTNAGGDRDFGVHDLAQLPTAWATIDIANTGNGDLSVSWNFATPAQGAGAAAFGFDVAAFSGTVAQGASCQIAFRLEGGSIGVNSIWVELWHNDLVTANPFRFELKGEVTAAPQISVSDSAGAITPGAAPSGPRDFGTVDVVNMPTTAVTITVANNGSADLHLGTPALTGVNTADFLMILSGYGNTVAPGSSTSFEIAFNAATIGLKAATVTFTHDDALVASPFTFDIAGIAISANQPLITTTALPNGMEGKAYARSITAAGGVGALAFTLASGTLPPGVQLAPTGELTGLPNVLGVYSFIVEVEDSVGSTNVQPLSLEIEFDPLTTGSESGGGGSGGGCAGSTGRSYAWLLLVLLVTAAFVARVIRACHGSDRELRR